jgi:hypothetical protein
MAIKERYSNPVVGDTVRLRLNIYNSNQFKNVTGFEEVNIYYLDPSAKTDVNPEGRVLFKTIASDDIVNEEEGRYYVDLAVTSPSFVVGTYVDSWVVNFDGQQPVSTHDSYFELFPSLWITSPIPVIYDFSFRFTPSKIVKGSKKYLRIEITPNVPRQSDLVRYYQNLAIVSDIYISMEIRCGECLPDERDLRLVIEEDLVELREKCAGYYFLDTTEMDCGIYDVWFKLNFGNNVFISDKQQLQIHD